MLSVCTVLPFQAKLRIWGFTKFREKHFKMNVSHHMITFMLKYLSAILFFTTVSFRRRCTFANICYVAKTEKEKNTNILLCHKSSVCFSLFLDTCSQRCCCGHACLASVLSQSKGLIYFAVGM